ncbi:MAG: diacylglycerol kinase family lipid kinase [Clostridia bacterium]|nr:diacylglycerol kinase family lipid kinase [Clostridia bacterium]
MKNVYLIINPHAGKAKAKTGLFDIINTFSKYDIRTTLDFTKYSGHAKDLIFSIDRDYDMVVCVGGDGTLNEVISGMIESGKNLPIGYIPAGSTNDFGTTLKLSKDFATAAANIAEGIVKSIDIGRFNDRYFTYVASFGAFTKTSYSTPQNIKNTFGHLAYILQGIHDLPSIRGEHLKLTDENGNVFEDDYIFGAVANSTSVGGVISFKESLISMNDGKFELLLVKKPKNIAELNKCINSILTQNYKSDILVFTTLKNCEIRSDSPLTWSLDGERGDTDGNVSLTVLENAVRMILPRSIENTCLLSAQKEN